MAAHSLSEYSDESNEYISKTPFSDEEKAKWISYPLKIALFQAIFASVLSSLRDLPKFKKSSRLLCLVFRHNGAYSGQVQRAVTEGK